MLTKLNIKIGQILKEQKPLTMASFSDPSDNPNRKALEAVEGLLKEFELLRKNKIPEGKAEDLLSSAQLIKAQLMGTRTALHTFIEKVETQRGKTISETEADAMISRARDILSQLGAD